MDRNDGPKQILSGPQFSHCGHKQALRRSTLAAPQGMGDSAGAAAPGDRKARSEGPVKPPSGSPRAGSAQGSNDRRALHPPAHSADAHSAPCGVRTVLLGVPEGGVLCAARFWLRAPSQAQDTEGFGGRASRAHLSGSPRARSRQYGARSEVRSQV